MARKMQLQSVNLTNLQRMSARDRASMLQSEYGRSLLSSLTAEQYARLFPFYYRKALPDISGFLKSVTPEGRRRLNAASISPNATSLGRNNTGTTGPNTARKSAEPTGKAVPSWMRKLEEAAGIKISDPGAKAQLSKDQKEVFELLKKGQINSDDPKVAFLKNMSDADLTAAGITPVRTEDGGLQGFKMAPTKASQMNNEEVIKAIGTGKVRAGTEGLKGKDVIRKQVYDAFTNAGFSDNQARALTAEVGRENSYRKSLIFGSHADPYNRRNNSGFFSWQKDRGTAVMNHLRSKGLVDDNGKIIQGQESLNEMARFARKEMETKYPRTNKLFLQNPNIDSEKAAIILGDDYIKWRRTDPRYAHHANYRKQYLAQITAINKRMPGLLPKNATPEQIESARKQLIEKEYEKRSTILAEKNIPKLPPGVSPEFAKEFEKLAPAQKQNLIAGISKLGEGKTGVDKFNELYKKDPEGTVKSGDNKGDLGRFNIYEELRKKYPKKIDTDSDLWKELDPSLKNSMRQILHRRTGKVNRDTLLGLDGIAKEAAKKGYGIRVVSGGDEHSANHGRGRGQNNAIDVQLLDPKTGKKVWIGKSLDSRSKIDLINAARDAMGPSAKHRFGVPMPGDHRGLHIQAEPSSGGKPAAMWGYQGGNAFSRSTVEKYEPDILKSFNEYNYNERKKAAEEAAKNIDRGAEKPQTNQPKSDINNQGLKIGDQPSTPPAPGLSPSAQPTASQPTAQPPNVAPASAEPTIEERMKASPVQAFADGGEESLKQSDNIKAYAIGALKGDNSIVVNDKNKPLFTMNTNKETAIYDPDSRKVYVEPVKNLLDSKPAPSRNRVVDPVQDKVPVLADGGSASVDGAAPSTVPDQQKMPEREFSPAEPNDLSFSLASVDVMGAGASRAYAAIGNYNEGGNRFGSNSNLA